MKRICVFGASITSGKCDSQGGWCDRLKRYLFDLDQFVFNLGISGDDTNDLLNRIEGECQARIPNTIIVALGGNDTHPGRISKDVFKDNYQKIIEICKGFTSDIILVGLTKVDKSLLDETFVDKLDNKILEDYDLFIEKIAENNNIPFIPTFDLKLTYSDGLHPDDAGHKLLFERIKNRLILL